MYFAQVSAHVAQLAERDESLEGLANMCDALLASAEGRYEDAERRFVELLKSEGEAYAVNPV